MPPNQQKGKINMSWSKKSEPETNDFKCEIKRHYATLESRQDMFTVNGTKTKGFLELNSVDFGKGESCDLRWWSADHSKMSKGIRLSNEAMCELEKFFVEGAEL